MLQNMSRTEVAPRATRVLSVAFRGAVVVFTAMVSEVDRAKHALATLITTLAALYSVALELTRDCDASVYLFANAWGRDLEGPQCLFVCKCLGMRPGRSALPLQKSI